MIRASHAQALEDVVFAIVIVPELGHTRLVAQTELNSLTNQQRSGCSQIKREFVRESITRSIDVSGLNIGTGDPFICRVAKEHLLLKTEILNPNGALNGGFVGHVGVFEANLLRVKKIKKVCKPSGLTEHGHERS